MDQGRTTSGSARAAATGRRVLVVTVVHHPEDARIWHRQIDALRTAGWQVTYAAPFTAYGLQVPAAEPGLRAVDLPRSSGRHRLGPLLTTRRILRRIGPGHDLVLLHDPELLPAAAGLDLPPVVWDVHEDTAAALQVRAWMPRLLRGPAAAAVRLTERWAERRLPLLLADYHYARRFARPHPVVPNTTRVAPDPLPAGTPDEHGRLRVVYLGSVTMERGAQDMVAVGRALHERTEGRVRLEVIGPAHGEAEEVLRSAADAGHLGWLGFLPNDAALRRVEGALAGLSLLHDEANFRPSMPTKVVEYMAHGVPVLTTPLPVPVELVTSSGGGVIVPFRDPEAVVEQLLAWAADPADAAQVGRRGHRTAVERLDWGRQSVLFVDALEAVASRGRGPGPNPVS